MLLALNKPWGVLCQFSQENREGEEPRPTLADFVDVPGVYPAGRLDRDSEGLLMLTDDGKLQNRIANPGHGTRKTYLAQVEGTPGHNQIQKLMSGVTLSDGPARALEVRLLARKPGWLWSRSVAVSPRKGKLTAWLEIVLSEGRNRQVRRMTAAVKLPTLRLIRVSVGEWSLEQLKPGEWREC